VTTIFIGRFVFDFNFVEKVSQSETVFYVCSRSSCLFSVYSLELKALQHKSRSTVKLLDPGKRRQAKGSFLQVINIVRLIHQNTDSKIKQVSY
jgi:hypothetical protein